MPLNDSGIVNIRGKQYSTVAKRIADFRVDHPSLTIETIIIKNSKDVVVIKSTIKDGEKVLSTGYAEEVRGSTNINKTSALENCETSAVGRALAFFGYGGTEIASANEVSDAIIQQSVSSAVEGFVSMNKCISDLFESVYAIKKGINDDDLSTAAGAWFELTDDEKQTLWKAPTKGGIFTTTEREVIKSTQFREAHYGASSASTGIAY